MAFALQVLIDGMSLGSFYALAALGIGLLFGVLKLINFAHGAFITFGAYAPVSYTHLRAHETKANLVCRLLLEKKNTQNQFNKSTKTSLYKGLLPS